MASTESSTKGGKKYYNFRDGSSPSSSDVFIALMGVTGAGKSSFIKTCCEHADQVQIGHDLQACTSVVSVYKCHLELSKTVYLIDTPGFDDTNRNDTEILREIAAWLTASYNNAVKLTGIIYLHRISDIRMQGSAKRNLTMFKKLCGPKALKNVILATTMWDKVTKDEGAERENQLVNTEEFWGWMHTRGSTIKRHTNDRHSAISLIEYLCTKDEITLELQDQMVNSGKNLNETSAGEELSRELVKERQRFAKELQETRAELVEAIKAKDVESLAIIREVRSESADKLEFLQHNIEALKISMQKLHEEKYVALEKMFHAEQAKHRKNMASLKAHFGGNQGSHETAKKSSPSPLMLTEKNLSKINENPDDDNVPLNDIEAMYRAARDGKLKTIKSLLAKGFLVDAETLYGNTALQAAAGAGHTSVVDFLIDKEADINISNSQGDTALMYAVSNDCSSIDMVRLLLARGASPNTVNGIGWSALHMASFSNRRDAAKLLLDHKAKIDMADRTGNTALMYAVRGDNSSKDMVQLLLAQGASPNATNTRGWTALHTASVEGIRDTTKLLLDHGASVNRQTRSGETALHIAARKGHEDLAALLLASGADTDIRNVAGATPKDIATEDIRNMMRSNSNFFLEST